MAGAFEQMKIIKIILIQIILIGMWLAACRPPQAIQSTITDIQPGQSIQACLDAANPGDVCRVMEGTYNEALVLKRSGTIDAPIVLLAVGKVTINSDNERSLVTSGNVHDWVIDGFQFISTLVDNSHPSKMGTVNFSYNYWGDGYQGERGNDRFVLKNCYIEGAVYIYGSDNLVENCELNGLGRFENGLIEAYQPSENNVFRNNIIHDYTERGGWTLQLTHDTTWEQNTVYNNGNMGIDCDGAGYPVHACNLIDNHIYDNTARGIELENCFDCQVTSNTISSSNWNLSIINYGDGPDFVTGGGIEYRDMDTHQTVMNNVISGGSYAIYCNAANGVTVRDNVIGGPTGILLGPYGGFNCDNWVVQGNEFIADVDWRLYKTQNNLIVQGNRYDNFRAYRDYVAVTWQQWQDNGNDIAEIPTATNTPEPTSTPEPTLTGTPTITVTPTPPICRITYHRVGVGWIWSHKVPCP